MKILITGGAGFIGSHTAKCFSSRNYPVCVVDNFSTGKTENLKGFRGKIEPCDITDQTTMRQIFSDFRPDAVIHLAAQSAITTAFEDPCRDLDVNGLGTLVVLKLAREFKVEKIVFSSTSAVYGKGNRFSASKEIDPCVPDTPYGISKLAAEQYIRLFFPNHVILRYANIYGPFQQPVGQNQVIARAFRHFLHGDDFFVVGDGKQKRDFVYVDDIANLNFLAVVEKKFKGTFNACSGRSYSVNEVLHEMEEIYDVGGYRWTHSHKKDDRGNVYINNSAIRAEIGWHPVVTLGEGLKLTAAWWEKEREPAQ